MAGSAVILAWISWGSPAMLWWGLLAAAPLLIHWWTRQRYQVVAWAAMGPLMAALQRHARRWRLEQWVLLALRTLILLAIAVAWAEPLWTTGPSRGAAWEAAATHHILVLDASYSMALREADASRFDLARQRAEAVVRDARQGDGFSLVLLADPPQVVVGEPVFDPDVIRAELRTVEPLHGGADLGATAAETLRLLDIAARAHPRLAQRRIEFFSDLGANTWRAVEDAETKRTVEALAARAELSVVEIGEGEPENLAVARIASLDPVPIAGREFGIEVEVRGYGLRGAVRKSLELFLDGQPAGVRDVEIGAEGRGAVSFSPRFELPGDHTMEVRLRDDRLEVDNVRWLSIPVRERWRVLCVEGRPGEARLAALALAPQVDSPTRMEVRVADETALGEITREQWDVVLLCNVARVDANDGDALRRFVAAGGGLAVFLGDLIQPDSYRQWLGRKAAAESLLPAELRAVVVESGTGVDPLNYRHPLAAPFKGQPAAGLLNTPVWRAYDLAPLDHARSRVALGLPSGRPFVVEGEYGRGRCLVVATASSNLAADRSTQPPTSWTAWPVWPSFVPLLHEIVKRLMEARLASRNVMVGEPLEADDSANFGLGPVTPSDVEIAGPQSSRSEGSLAVSSTQRIATREGHWAYTATQRSGLYEVRRAEAAGDAEWYAVNVDPMEGDTARYDASALPTALRPNASAPATVDSVSRAGRRSWFRELLLGVGAALLVESSLAYRFGTRRLK